MRPCSYLNFLTNRSIGSNAASQCLIRDVGTQISRYYLIDLKAHFGCVNAIEFSHSEKLLASGGDDRRILVWMVGKALTSSCTAAVPARMKAEHNSNIFCLSFNTTDDLLVSGGNDGCIVTHDVSSSEHKDTFLYDEAIYSITSDPVNSSVFVAAAHDGKALLYDIRSSEDCMQFTDSLTEPMYAVQYNRVCPMYLASISGKNTARLWDMRKLSIPVLKYSYASAEYNGMSLSFNSQGDRLLVIGRREPPLIYDWVKEKPIHEFNGEGYYCACTIKSCCWAGPFNEYIAVGSDNFKVYMWKVPKEAGADNYLIKSASRILDGHRSIVNQLRYNDSFCVLASSGVEKIIKMWSPFNISGSEEYGVAGDRSIYTHQQYIDFMLRGGNLSHNYTDESMEEDPKMIAFFDSILQRELQVISDSSEQSEEASLRIYNYELSTSDSSSSSEAIPSRSRRRNAVYGGSTSSNSDSDAFGRMSPFSEAFLSRVLSHHANGETTDQSNSPSVNQPTGTSTMTELINKRKQVDLKRSLALAKKRLRRQQRKADIQANGRNKNVSDTESCSTEGESSKLSSSKRKKCLKRERMKRILQRIAIDELSKSSSSESDTTETSGQERECTTPASICVSGNHTLDSKKSENKEKISALLSLKRSYDSDDQVAFKEKGDISQEKRPEATVHSYGDPLSYFANHDSLQTNNLADISEPTTSIKLEQFKKSKKDRSNVDKKYRRHSSEESG